MSNAYVNKTFADGDKDIHFPYWRQVLQKETRDFKAYDLEVEQQKWQFINEDEIALKHPVTGSTFKLADDGSIEMFVNEDTGIRIDSKDNSIIFYGDSVHFATKEMRIHTKPHSLIWNNYNFNPYFYYGDDKTPPHLSLSSTGEYPRQPIPLFQEQTRKHYYDDKVTAMIENLGIETKRTKREG